MDRYQAQFDRLAAKKTKARLFLLSLSEIPTPSNR